MESPDLQVFGQKYWDLLLASEVWGVCGPKPLPLESALTPNSVRI